MGLSNYKDDKEKCCNCKNCMKNCPVNAIEFTQETNGFMYPKINSNCIECKICDKLCYINSNFKRNVDGQQFFAFINNNNEELDTSTSGGAFLSISKYFFENSKTIIYGAETIYDRKIYVKHTRAVSFEDSKKFSGSKYINSDISDIYNYIKEDYKNYDKLIFTGLPCQIYAIKQFIKLNNYDVCKFFFIDLICHGVGSEIFFQRYVDFLEKKYKSKIIKFSFRFKILGWKGYPYYAEFENGLKLKNTFILRNYPILYTKGYIIRKSCFNCSFANLNRFSDITLGDFWGADKIKFETSKGVSLIIANTEEGKNISKQLIKYGTMQEISKGQAIEGQGNLINIHSEIPKDYEKFWEDYYKEKDLSKLLKKYGGLNIQSFIKYYLKKLLVKLRIKKV